MADAFPVGFARIELRPGASSTFLMEESGLLITGRKPSRPWTGTLTTPDLSRDQHARLFAALVDAEAGNRRFDFVHPLFELPRAYTRETWPLTVDPFLVAVTDLYTIAVAGLPIGMKLQRGDRLSLIKDETICYCMLSADVNVGSMQAQTISVLPRLPIGVFEAGDTVRLKSPPVRLAVVPGTSRRTDRRARHLRCGGGDPAIAP